MKLASEMTIVDYIAAHILPSVFEAYKDESYEDMALIAYNIADTLRLRLEIEQH